VRVSERTQCSHLLAAPATRGDSLLAPFSPGWLGDAHVLLGGSCREVARCDLRPGPSAPMAGGRLAASCARHGLGQGYCSLWFLQERIQFSPNDKHEAEQVEVESEDQE